MKILYLNPAGAFSGASRSLLELLRAFPAGAVEPRLLVATGLAADLFEKEGFALLRAHGISQLDLTRYGHYRGPRWLILARELWYLPFTLRALLRARRQWGQIDLIHANEITALPAAIIAKRLFGRPLVVHVRSVQLTEGAPLRRKLLERLLARHADAVVAIDETVRASLPQGLAARVVHNGFDPGNARREPAPDSSPLRVGMIGSLLALKGVYDFLEAARICLARGADVEFVLVGSNVRALAGLKGNVLKALGFARDVEGDIDDFVARHGLGGRVRRLGFTTDVAALYRNLDVLCFPSHLDAVGRPVLEAAWFGVPAVAAVERPSPDTFVPGETGVRVPARDPRALAEAILALEADREGVRRMGAAARRLAERNFDSRKNAREMLAIYEELLERRNRSALAA